MAVVIRMSRNPEQRAEASEFSWGEALTPKGLENAPPAQGGRYHGKTPLMDLTSPPTDSTGRVITGKEY